MPQTADIVAQLTLAAQGGLVLALAVAETSSWSRALQACRSARAAAMQAMHPGAGTRGICARDRSSFLTSRWHVVCSK